MDPCLTLLACDVTASRGMASRGAEGTGYLLAENDREGALDTGPDKCAACSSWGCVRISRAAWTGPSLSNRSCVWFSILRES
ncbi:hypothetical protein JOQ06_017361 [Pogonophryne albipinna]|uniref:Uncharacterized protein n=1 Tax=Pogonophryne albipinna TaxID=1090488 RepID=A0AAD6B429_9TELE|nr:hypothetical protein JOQ06_017361 [Pogonophryne albipinna]